MEIQLKIMNNGLKNVRETDDEEHKKVVVMTEERQKNPEAGKKWNDEFMAKFNELPEE